MSPDMSPNANKAPSGSLMLDDETVIRYLRAHPEFFARHPGFTADILLPHDSGQAVSLVERQVSLLRERNIELRKRLASLLHAASDNDQLFAKTRTLTLALLDAPDLASLEGHLRSQLLEDFGADFISCHYAGVSPRQTVSASLGLVQHCAGRGDIPLPQMTGNKGRYCGPLRAEEMTAAFGPEANSAGSAVLVTLQGPSGSGLTGLLAIGSRQPGHFSPDMGTLFISHLGDVLARALLRVL